LEERAIIVSQQAGIINTNFEELKVSITEQMQVYMSLEVTEANKPERKKDIATLRKISKALNDKKVEVKNEFLTPYYEFENQVKGLQEIISQPINFLDNQVKEYEEKQRLEKIQYINDTYTELSGELAERISLSVLYDSKWENATVSKKTVKDDLTDKIAEIQQGIAVIKGMNSDKSEAALEMYYENLNLPTAIGFINRYEQQKKEILAQQEEQRKRDYEAELEREKERVRRETVAQVERENEVAAAAKQEVYKEMQAEKEVMAVQKQSSTTTYATYTFEATEQELQQIEMYCSSLGVDFERVI
jgi:hypothetical protein